MNRVKTFNIFILLATLARSLIDSFIPIILYEKGLEVKYIIAFLLLYYCLSFILSVPLGYICKKMTFKWAMIVTSFIVGISYYYLLVVEINIMNMLIFAVTHVITTQVYWISHHYYALEILPKRDLADEVGNIIIFSTLAIIPVSYVGALLMNNLDMELVLVIIVFLYITSVIPLFKIKERKKETQFGIMQGIKEIVSNAPSKSLWFLVLAQFRMIGRYLFPLAIFIYIKNNYEYIGIFNIAVGIASMFFVYFFSRKMDRDKKDYLILSGVLGSIIYLLKLNIVDTGIILLVGLFEGMSDKMYDVAFNRNLYALGHHYDGASYAVLAEGFQNLSRLVIVLLFVLLSFDLKLILYIAALMLTITGIIGFDDGEGGY